MCLSTRTASLALLTTTTTTTTTATINRALLGLLFLAVSSEFLL
jgi:hypothetical protein